MKYGALEVTPETRRALYDRIGYDTSLGGFDKRNAERALGHLLGGEGITRGDVVWIERMFGRDIAEGAVKHMPWSAKLKREALGLLNMPRALKASFDLSWGFRQGLVAGARYPRLWSKSWADASKAAVSKKHYEMRMDEIVSSPTFALKQKAKLALTDLDDKARAEEGYMSEHADLIPGVRQSGRAYTLAGNEFRSRAFDQYLEKYAEGKPITGRPLTERDLEGLAEVLNVATGRGAKLGGFTAEHAQLLNGMFFSPQLIASRLKLLNPVWYYKLPPVARYEAIRSMLHLAGLASMTLWLAKQAGAAVELDPRSSDWGKVRIGDTRIDILGGLGQYIVLGARFAANEYKRYDGAIIPYEGGYGGSSRYKAVTNFAENKLAPVPSTSVDWMKDENFDGEPYDPKKEIPRLFLPLGFEATWDANKEYGPGMAAATFAGGGVGLGIQTYGPPEPKSSTSRSKPGKRSKRGSRPKPGSGSRSKP
jgi:hypothetical protein